MITLAQIATIATISGIAGYCGYLQAELNKLTKLRINATFGIENRTSIELDGPHQVQEVLFFDIDKMHELNDMWGYDEVDARLRHAMTRVRVTRGSRFVQWYSGDEFCYICNRGEAEIVRLRIECLLAEQDITATYAIARVLNTDWRDAVSKAKFAVQEQKRARDHATICKDMA